MKILVDADACPVAVKETLFRAAVRKEIAVILIANHAMRVPNSEWVRFIQVPHGFDAADDDIVERVEAGDLVITADIPLSADVIKKGGFVLSPRGESLTKSNIGARLNMRDFLETMRSSGVETGGPPAFGQADKKAFADALDRFLSKYR